MKIQHSFGSRADGLVGALYLVATPIGNLEDMTFRSIRILKEADVIAAEDTRQTRKLLTHYQISGRLVSYHEHNKLNSGPELVRLMSEGQRIALVSDAGLPAISDPGEELVRLAVDAGLPVIPIPGANAALSALICSGLPAADFRFVGFLPRNKKALGQSLTALASDSSTLIFYEAPHRVRKTLEAMLAIWGDRKAVLARELTKRYEEFARGTLEEAIHHLDEHPPMGEYCLVVEGADPTKSAAEEASTAEQWWQKRTLLEHVSHYQNEGIDRMEAMKRTAQDRGISKREVYKGLLQPPDKPLPHP